MPRLFIGIPVPDSYRERLLSITLKMAARLRSQVRWTQPANAHMTLKFLGSVNDDTVPEIQSALRSIAFPPFLFRAGGCGCFPNSHKPRVIWAGTSKGAKACAQLAEAINDALIPVGFEPDERQFKCHLTLGRVKTLFTDDWEAALREANGLWPGYEVDHFTLWKSELTSQGPIYTVVEEYPLDEG